jgi:hypothetical protein
MSAFDPKRTLRHHPENRDLHLANARWIVRQRDYAAILSNSLRAARLTNSRSILLETTATFLRRNCAIVDPSRMPIDQPR